MASPAEPMTSEPGLLWLFHWPFDAPPPLGIDGVALVCDLASNPWSNAVAMATARDLGDARRPGSTTRTHFLQRRHLSKQLLSWVIGCRIDEIEIGYDDAGAPRVTSHPSYHISVAARDATTALAVGRRPIGVDVETLALHRPIAAVLHPLEASALAGLDAERASIAFLRIWTMKEAYLKATGAGFTRDPTAIAVLPDDDRRARLLDSGAPVASATAQWRSVPERSVMAAVFYAA